MPFYVVSFIHSFVIDSRMKHEFTEAKILTQGKAKTVYTTQDPTKLILEFRDDTSAFNGEKNKPLRKRQY